MKNIVKQNTNIENYKQLATAIQKYNDCNVYQLALKKNHNKEIDFTSVINQIAIRQKNSKKFPTLLKNYDFFFPLNIAVEQSSSEITAKYKSEIISNFNNSADLTGGLGIDSLYFAKKAAKHIYCEQNSNYCDFFRNNCDVLNQNNIEIVNQEAENFIKKCYEQKIFFDVVYIDPSRRNNNNQKKFLLKDLQPDILVLQENLAKITPKTIIKFSPMLDISSVLEDIKNINEIHIVSLENECKELLVVLDFTKKDFNENEIKYFAVNLKNLHSQNLEIQIEKIELKKNVNEKINFSFPQKYIYEPNPSIMKLGFWADFCCKFSLNKLHQNSHLFTSAELLPNFPGRVFELITSTKFSSKEIKNILQKEKKANITTRNFPYSVEDIYKKLKLKNGGNHYIFATTTIDNKLALLITSRLADYCSH